MELWNEYQEEALARFKKANGGKLKDMILWTSHMTEPEFLHYLDPSIYTVQYWESSTNKQVNIPGTLPLHWRVPHSFCQ